MAETPKFMIPFSVPAANRTETFTQEMEKAAVFCLAETERRKGGGLLLKKQEERLTFLAEFWYPLWLAPWSDLTLVFDGLRTTVYALAYGVMADVDAFEQGVQRSSKSQETYMSFLADNVNYFQMTEKEKTISTIGLRTEPNLLDEIRRDISSAKPFDPSPVNIIPLSSLLDQTRILSVIRELDEFANKFKKEINTLYESMKTIDKTTQNFVKITRDKIQAVKDEYRAEIGKQEKIATPKINTINELYDQQVTQTARNYQRQILPVQKEKVKLEKTKEQAISKIEKAKAEAKANAAKKDEAREKKWKEKADESKKELSETENKLKQIEKSIKTIEEGKTVETFRVKSEWEAKINETKKDILELENQRDARIQLRQQEIDKLETLTVTIIQQIGMAVKRRENDLSSFERLGIQQKRKELALLYIPFYIASYRASSRKRYAVFTPSYANNVRLATKIKGALGRARYRNLLTPRFEFVAQLLYNVPMMAEQKAVLGREIDESGSNSDLTKAEEARGLLKAGLEKIRREGWFSEKEYANFIETLDAS